MNDPMKPEHFVRPVATCGAHPDAAATSTCVQCGDFRCAQCELDYPSTCRICQTEPRGEGFPFHRSAFAITGLIGYSWQRFKGQWFAVMAACFAALVTFALVFFVSVLLEWVVAFVTTALRLPPTTLLIVEGASAVLVNAISIFSQVAVQLGALRVFVDVVEGRPADADSYLSGLKRSVAGVVQVLVVYALMLLTLLPFAGVGAGLFFALDGTLDEAALWVAVAFAIAIVPLAWVSLGLTFMQSELVYDLSVGPVEAMRRSWAMVRGHRITIIVFYLFSMVVLIAGVLACCVGFVPAYGFVLLLQTSLFLTLRNGLLPSPGAG